MMDSNNSLQNDVISAVIKFETDAELAAVELFRDYPEPLLRVASVCCVLIMLIGIPGNLITIVALARFKKVRNASALFIVNLHISDFIVCSLILPMTFKTFSERRWTNGVAMCRLYSLFKCVLNSVSIFTVSAISINRYVMFCHPRIYPRVYKRRNLTMMLLTIWISAFLIFLVSLFGIYGRFDLDLQGGFCTMVTDDNNRSPRNILLYLILLSYITMVLCYARLWWVVRKSAKQSLSPNARPTHLPIANVQLNSLNVDKAPFRLTRKEVQPKIPTRRDKKLRTMIVAIMLSFCLSHFPVIVIRLVYKNHTFNPYANIISRMLQVLSACINPIVYVLISNDYRKAYMNLSESVLKIFKVVGNK